MGSKMSFGRGSSDQNTVSELTSVASHPRNSICAPSDCKQIPEDKRCGEEDLESRWGEEMKPKELTQPAHESQSSGKLESEGLADSEANCGEHVLSQEGMEAKSQLTSAIMCSSTTPSHGHLMDAYKKRGRPRKMRSLLRENKKDPDSAALGAIKHEEISATIPLPTCLENHKNEDVPKAVDCSLINNTPHNEMSDDKVEDYVSVLPKKRRGRPRKSEIADFKAMVVKTAAAAAAAAGAPASAADANVSGPARRLRSRGEQHLSRQDAESEMVPTESHNTLNFQVIKRRRAKAADQQVPVKVSRLNLPQEAPTALSNYTGCEEKAEANKQVELNADKQGTDTDGKGNQLSPQSGGQEQQTELKEGALPQKRLCSQPAAEPEVIPLNSVNLVSPSQSHGPEIQQSDSMNGTEESQSKSSLEPPKNANMQNAEASCTDVVTSSKQPPKSVAVLPPVKSENIEVELAHFNPMSKSNNSKSLQHSANSVVQSEGPVYQRITFRRKRGGKRRRRISNVLLQTAHPVESHEGSSDTQQKTDCGDAEQEGNSNANANIIYIKRGGKTLLKCGFCGHIFKFMSQCIIHLRIHTGERPFKCPECGKGFTKNSNLNLHLKTHRKSNIYQKCPFCKIKFSCTEYASHMKLHAQVLNQDSENNKSERRSKSSDVENSPGVQRPVSPEKREKKVCQYCGKTFPFQSALIRHVRVHTGEKPYKCDICGKAFGQAYFLRVHELTHWSVKRYNCTRCEKSFTHYSNAKNHTCRPPGGGDDLQPSRRVKPSLTYTCHICKNVFDHLQEFNSHMRAHTGAKLYRCLYCDKLFGVLTEFNSHRSQCGGERSASSSAIKEEPTMSLIQYTVPALRCSSGQNSAPLLAATNCETQKKMRQTSRKKRCANLKKPFQSTVIPAQHLSHLVSKLNKLDNRSDPRKYLCPSCGRLFRHMGRLRAHMLTHAPGQSYTCACCGKTLESWKKLWHHQRIHRQRRGRFTCPQCGEGFRFVELYKKHMSEHPEFQWIQVRPKKVFLPYQCDQCRCSFKTLDLLFSHQLCHSSTQDAHKDSDFDLAIDDHTTQSNKKIFNPPTNNYMVTSQPQPEENNLTLSPLPRNPDLVFQESPLDPMIPFVHNQGLDFDKPCQNPDSAYSVQDSETSQGKIEENAPDIPITPLRTVKRHTAQNACISNEGSSDGFRCAVCGNAYPAISDLYHHYLQHARGQV